MISLVNNIIEKNLHKKVKNMQILKKLNKKVEKKFDILKNSFIEALQQATTIQRPWCGHGNLSVVYLFFDYCTHIVVLSHFDFYHHV